MADGQPRMLASELARRKRGCSSTNEPSMTPIKEKHLEISKKPKTASKDESRNMSCPYYVRWPQEHCKRTSCSYPGFRNVSRLKEHLYRYHLLPPRQCPRCCTTFETDQDLRNHLRSPHECEISGSPPEGISAEQEKLLKSRKRTSHRMSEEDKWRRIYQIVFPDISNDDVPSPYWEQHHQVKNYQLGDFEAFAKLKGGQIIQARLETQKDKLDLSEEQQMEVTNLLNSVHEQLLEEYQSSHGHDGTTSLSTIPASRNSASLRLENQTSGSPVSSSPAPSESPRGTSRSSPSSGTSINESASADEGPVRKDGVREAPFLGDLGCPSAGNELWNGGFVVPGLLKGTETRTVDPDLQSLFCLNTDDPLQYYFDPLEWVGLESTWDAFQ